MKEITAIICIEVGFFLTALLFGYIRKELKDRKTHDAWWSFGKADSNDEKPA